MATLRDIRRRVSAVRDIQQITKAMKMVAAARLRRAQERILLARPYAHKMEEVLCRLAGHTASEFHPLLSKKSTGRHLLVLITSDKGLCGSFNHNVLRQGWEFMKGAAAKGEETYWVAVGRKAKEFLRARGSIPQTEHIHIFGGLSYQHAARICQDLLRLHDDLDLEEVLLLYNEFRSAGQHKVTWGKLLPIEPAMAESCPIPVDYLYEPSAGQILRELLPKYVEVQIYHALMESAAAEQAARMASMEMAQKNAGEMIHSLTLLYNKVRQERITKELLEVVAGAEALR